MREWFYLGTVIFISTAPADLSSHVAIVTKDVVITNTEGFSGFTVVLGRHFLVDLEQLSSHISAK